MPRPRRWDAARLERLLDLVKDEIDGLNDIKHPRQHVEAARELIEYLELHHVDAIFEDK